MIVTKEVDLNKPFKFTEEDIAMLKLLIGMLINPSGDGLLAADSDSSILTVLGIAAAGSLPLCCLGLFAFGLARGVLECTVYPALFDVVVPQFRAACTGMAGCWAFLFGSMAPAVLGWMSQRFTLRMGFVSLTAFVAAGVVLLVFARLKFLRGDMLTYGEVVSR